jgi:hypothetical protein
VEPEVPLHFTLTDLITDITQNGAESGASVVELQLSEIRDASGKGELRFTVIDNGKGMNAEELKRAQDPFVTDGVKHPHRKVGLGLPFLIQTAEASGGGWEMKSKKAGESEEPGTVVSAWFDLGNVDTPPVGDIPGMFRTVLLFSGPEEMVIKRLRKSLEGAPEGAPSDDLDYEVRKTDLSGALGDLEDTQSLILLDRYLRSLEEAGD